MGTFVGMGVTYQTRHQLQVAKASSRQQGRSPGSPNFYWPSHSSFEQWRIQ